MIDVGKADAILLESPDANVLVDCGTAEAAEDVLRYLAARGIDRLDAVWISHPDDDHCGGLPVVLQTVPADEVVESPVGESISGMTALPQAVPLRRAAVGERCAYGAMTFEVLGPLQDYAESNNDSTVFRLQYDGFTMLFCGDMEAQAERDLLEDGAALRADVLKVAHHGSDTSTSARFAGGCSAPGMRSSRAGRTAACSRAMRSCSGCTRRAPKSSGPIRTAPSSSPQRTEKSQS